MRAALFSMKAWTRCSVLPSTPSRRKTVLPTCAAWPGGIAIFPVTRAVVGWVQGVSQRIGNITGPH